MSLLEMPCFERVESYLYRTQLVSGGMDGEGWVNYFRKERLKVSQGIKTTLLSDFQPSKRGYRYNVLLVGVKYVSWFGAGFEEAKEFQTDRGLKNSTFESMCLLRAACAKNWFDGTVEQIVSTQDPIPDLDIDSGGPGMPVIRSESHGNWFLGFNVSTFSRFCSATTFAYLE